MDISNIFDFLDYLEGFNRTVGTANENRAFIFETLGVGINLPVDITELSGAYDALGFTVPDAIFSNIYDFVHAEYSLANMVQVFAPTSKLPINDIPIFSGDLNTNFIVYSDVVVTNPITGDTYTQSWYHKFNNVYTTSELTQQIATSVKTKYNIDVNSVQMFRIYKNENGVDSALTDAQ